MFLKGDSKVTLLDLTLAQIGVSGRFLDPILTLLEIFSCVCELIFLKLHLITGFNKSVKNGCFAFLKKIYVILKIG